MNTEELKTLAEKIAAYNTKNAGKCEINEFITYPEPRKNGAVVALQFKTTHWGKTEFSTIEYNSIQQLMNWFAYHA